MRTAGRQRTPGNLGDARGLGGGRLRSGQGPGLLRASDVRPESWALERRPLASKEWPFPQQPPSPAACEAWGFLDGLTEGVEQVLSHPSERWPRAGPGPPWEHLGGPALTPINETIHVTAVAPPASPCLPSDPVSTRQCPSHNRCSTKNCRLNVQTHR